MMESQRYPDDFDGIVAAAPAYDWTGITAGFVQNQQAIYPTGDLDSPVLTPDTLELLGSSILAACDDDDGVVDGAMTAPVRVQTCRPAPVPRRRGGGRLPDGRSARSHRTRVRRSDLER